MIPKVIHYCWFGRSQKPVAVLRFISNWRQILPNYVIKEWNEDNFDVKSIPYAQEAYSARRFAFVADCARLYALAVEGGIYLDTDVEVLNTFDSFLSHPAFIGYESEVGLCTAVIGAEKDNILIRTLLEDYRARHFIRPDGTMNETVNVIYVTKCLKKYGLTVNGLRSDLSGICSVYPKDYFSPKSESTGEITLTPNTVTIHHLSASWYSRREKVVLWASRHLGRKMAKIISLLWHNPIYIVRRSVRYFHNGC